MKLKTIVEQILKETEFYHAADKNALQSFVTRGIVPDLAGTKHGGAGANQGKGFYVYKDKNEALRHAKNNGEEIIVVIDEPLNVDEFDVDHEGEYVAVVKFIGEHWDFFFKNWKQLGIHNHVVKNQPPTMKGVFRISFDGERTGTFNTNTNSKIDIGKDRDPTLIWKMVQAWKKINPQLFTRFEQENVKGAQILKYNGDRKIAPTRIEDLEGNILWKRK
jgi:hypothetical protein